MLVLKALSLGPMHGYGIGQRIQQLAQDMLQVEEGTLYPALYRIENRGWIEGEWGVSTNNRRARFYKLTPDGRKTPHPGVCALPPGNRSRSPNHGLRLS